MSASPTQLERALGIVFLCSLFGYSSALSAQEQEVPDLEFLEYLGSWDESDEDWVLLAEDDGETPANEDESNTAPQGDKVAELEHEN